MKSHLTKCKQIMNEVPKICFLLDGRFDCAARRRELFAVQRNFPAEGIAVEIDDWAGPLGETQQENTGVPQQESVRAACSPGEMDAVSPVLFLADSYAICRALSSGGFPAAGYLHGGNRAENFPGVSYLLEEPQFLDADSAVKIWQRLTGRPWVIAQTDRLLIREMTEEDLDAIYLLYEDPQAEHFLEPLNEDRGTEREMLRAYIDKVYPLYGFGMWAVCDRENGELIGRIGFAPWHSRTQDIELGYLIRADRRRQGLAGEAAGAVLQFAKESLGAVQVSAQTASENTASLALLRRMGFEEVDGSGEKGILYFRKSL